MSRQPSRTEGLLRPAISIADAQCSILADLFGVEPSVIAPVLLRATAAVGTGVNPIAALELPFVTKPPLESSSQKAEGHLMDCASTLAATLSQLALPPAYSIGGLAEARVGQAARRTGGVYFTDFLVAEDLVGRALANHHAESLTCVDPAAGGGSFLVAAARQIAQFPHLGVTSSAFIAEFIHGVDRNASAVDACASALLAESGDLQVINPLLDRLVVMDSLLAGNPTTLTNEWRTLFPKIFDQGTTGFDLVLGNPPWEKLKIHTHEHLNVSRDGGAGAYGSSSKIRFQERQQLNDRRVRLRSYLCALRSSGYVLQDGGGDPDLYRYFFELALGLVSPQGTIALLLPGALARARGAQPLRDALVNRFGRVDMIFFENKARFFPIDTRFKFVACLGSGSDGLSELCLSAATLRGERIEVTPPTQLSKEEMALIDRGAGIPEILDAKSKEILLKCLSAGTSSTVAGWGGTLMREVDMTRDKPSFLKSPIFIADGLVPVLEGRMVHQFRHAAKVHVQGEGRSAEWANSIACQVQPQYWISEKHLSAKTKQRIQRARAGFCDITGQTNERTLLASVIPAQVVCGNKVPTVEFDDDFLMYSWVALMNTFTADWLVRRICTTTINYFILEAIPLPSPKETIARLSGLGRRLSVCESHGIGGDEMPAGTEERIETDLVTLELFGLDPNHLWHILKDFPLLDRAQPPIHDERRSTVTRDMLLAASLRKWNLTKIDAAEGLTLACLEDRIQQAHGLGATPYVPTDLAKASTGANDQGELFALA